MKNAILFSMIILCSSFSCSQDRLDSLYLKRVQTLDETVAALYSVISGAAGEERNWELFQYLFKSDAKLIPSGNNPEGQVGCRYMSTSDYIQSSGKWLEQNGFFEVEIARRTETFGSLTHVFSTYEAFRTKQDTEPFMRGINSIQLLKDEKRWWIVNIYWANEAAENPLPEKYLRQ